MGWAMADRRSSCAKNEFKSVLNKTAANSKLRLTMINTRKLTPKLRQLSRRWLLHHHYRNHELQPNNQVYYQQSSILQLLGFGFVDQHTRALVYAS